MKWLFLVAILSLVSIDGYTQCNIFFDFEKGVKWEFRSYDKKDKVVGISHHEVKEISESDGYRNTTFEVKLMTPKGKEIVTQESVMECREGTMHTDMSKYAYKGKDIPLDEMNVSVDSEGLQYPNVLNVGDKLNHAQRVISIRSEYEVGSLYVVIKFTDRIVEAKEEVVTPAGTFECYKISYISTYGKNTHKSRTVEWISSAKGIVKIATYNEKGKLTGYSQIVSFTG